MLKFLSENWTQILSIVGAAAWIPIIFRTIVNYFRRIQVTLLDSRTLTDGTGLSVGRKCTKQGTILLLAMNFYIKGTDIFARKLIIK